MGKEEWIIKRRVWAYVLTGIVAAASIAGAVLAFVYPTYAVGATLAVLAVLFVLCLAAEVVQDNLLQRCQRLFAAQKFEEENALLQKIKGNHLLFPFMRERYYLLAIRNALARDDLALVASYIARLRHNEERVRQGDDRHLLYKTAYAHILLLLDEGNIDAARAEYEDFRIHNEHFVIYAKRLEILNAIFERLAGKDTPLPDTIAALRYPVIERILSRMSEEKAATNDD